jgi:hypothetical protein
MLNIFNETFLFEKYKGWSTKKENIYDKIHFLIVCKLNFATCTVLTALNA